MSSLSAPQDTDTTQKTYLQSATETVQKVVDSMAETVRGGGTTQPSDDKAQKPSDDKDQKSAPEAPQPTGTYNQTVGSAKQAAGAALGNERLRREGEEQNARGQEEEAKRHLQDWGEGVQGRVKGKVGEALAPGDVAGDWTKVHEDAKAKQKMAEEKMEKRYGGSGTGS